MRRCIFISILSLIILFVNGMTDVQAARVYVDALGALTETDDTRDQRGGGFSFGTEIDRLMMHLKCIFNSGAEHGSTYGEENYYYFMAIFTLQYAWRIPGTRLYATGAAGIGPSYIRAEYESKKLLERQYEKRYPGTNADFGGTLIEIGPTVAAWAGLMFHFSQHLSFFTEIGYHRSFYSYDFKNKEIDGMQFLAGIRLTVVGKNRSIFDE